jgi:hypothetical protein
VLGGVAALISVGTFAVLQLRKDAIPALDPQQFEAARLRWQSNGLADYDIETVVAGPQSATYSVSVRNGTVTQALREGSPLTQPRTMGTWSVPGMFRTIEIDLENIAEHPDSTQLILRAEFDSLNGLPRQYQRIDLKNQTEVRWKVKRFEEARGERREARS